MCSVCFIRGSYTSWFQVSVTSTNSNNLWVSVLWQNHASCVGSNQKNTPRTQGIRLPNTYDKSRDCFEFLAISTYGTLPMKLSLFLSIVFTVLSGSANDKSFLQSRHVLRPPWLAAASSGGWKSRPCSLIFQMVESVESVESQEWIHYSKLQSQSVCLNFGTQIHGKQKKSVSSCKKKTCSYVYIFWLEPTRASDSGSM